MAVLRGGRFSLSGFRIATAAASTGCRLPRGQASGRSATVSGRCRVSLSSCRGRRLPSGAGPEGRGLAFFCRPGRKRLSVRAGPICLCCRASFGGPFWPCRLSRRHRLVKAV